MASKPVVARLKDGREFGFKSEKIALELHPDAEIVRHTDNSPIEGKAEKQEQPDTGSSSDESEDSKKTKKSKKTK